MLGTYHINKASSLTGVVLYLMMPHIVSFQNPRSIHRLEPAQERFNLAWGDSPSCWSLAWAVSFCKGTKYLQLGVRVDEGRIWAGGLLKGCQPLNQRIKIYLNSPYFSSQIWLSFFFSFSQTFSTGMWWLRGFDTSLMIFVAASLVAPM